jgi:hypothetical protein
MIEDIKSTDISRRTQTSVGTFRPNLRNVQQETGSLRTMLPQENKSFQNQKRSYSNQRKSNTYANANALLILNLTYRILPYEN